MILRAALFLRYVTMARSAVTRITPVFTTHSAAQMIRCAAVSVVPRARPVLGVFVARQLTHAAMSAVLQARPVLGAIAARQLTYVAGSV